LRASTTMITAFAHGCASITPVADPAEARRLAAAQGADVALAAGERRGEPVPGLDLGNSPVEFAIERVRGRAVYFTTSNGTRALRRGRHAPPLRFALGATARRRGARRRRHGVPSPGHDLARPGLPSERCQGRSGVRISGAFHS